MVSGPLGKYMAQHQRTKIWQQLWPTPAHHRCEGLGSTETREFALVKELLLGCPVTLLARSRGYSLFNIKYLDSMMVIAHVWHNPVLCPTPLSSCTREKGNRHTEDSEIICTQWQYLPLAGNFIDIAMCSLLESSNLVHHTRFCRFTEKTAAGRWGCNGK